MQIARTETGGIFYVVSFFYRDVDKNGLKNFEEVEQAVTEVCIRYEVLFHRPEEFSVKYPQLNIAEKLTIMKSFNIVMPLPVKTVKCGKMMFKHCVHVMACYRPYECAESVVVSMLFNPELLLPDVERAEKVKAKAKVLSFNAEKNRTREDAAK